MASQVFCENLHPGLQSILSKEICMKLANLNIPNEMTLKKLVILFDRLNSMPIFELDEYENKCRQTARLDYNFVNYTFKADLAKEISFMRWGKP